MKTIDPAILGKVRKLLGPAWTVKENHAVGCYMVHRKSKLVAEIDPSKDSDQWKVFSWVQPKAFDGPCLILEHGFDPMKLVDTLEELIANGA